MKSLTELRAQIVNEMLDNLFTATDLEHRTSFIDAAESDLIAYHSTLGRSIRNQYDLWFNSTLVAAGIHPDSFSYDCIVEIHTRAIERFRRSLLGK